MDILVIHKKIWSEVCQSFILQITEPIAMQIQSQVSTSTKNKISNCFSQITERVFDSAKIHITQGAWRGMEPK